MFFARVFFLFGSHAGTGAGDGGGVRASVQLLDSADGAAVPGHRRLPGEEPRHQRVHPHRHRLPHSRPRVLWRTQGHLLHLHCSRRLRRVPKCSSHCSMPACLHAIDSINPFIPFFQCNATQSNCMTVGGAAAFMFDGHNGAVVRHLSAGVRRQVLRLQIHRLRCVFICLPFPSACLPPLPSPPLHLPLLPCFLPR